MQHIHKVVEIPADRGKRGLPVGRVYRHLWREDLLTEAYARIGKNGGATTAGIDSETVDGMSLEKIHRIAQVLQANDWRWSPARRVEIPKSRGGTGPLGLPRWPDKLVQQAIRSLLEPDYEPQFSRFSYGSRRGLGCHHALDHIRHHWVGAKWFIEGDTVKCFDHINHSPPPRHFAREGSRPEADQADPRDAGSGRPGGLGVPPHPQWDTARWRPFPTPGRHLPGSA
jgi:hypothetical protein